MQPLAISKRVGVGTTSFPGKAQALRSSVALTLSLEHSFGDLSDACHHIYVALKKTLGAVESGLEMPWPFTKKENGQHGMELRIHAKLLL